MRSPRSLGSCSRPSSAHARHCSFICHSRPTCPFRTFLLSACRRTGSGLTPGRCGAAHELMVPAASGRWYLGGFDTKVQGHHSGFALTVCFMRPAGCPSPFFYPIGLSLSGSAWHRDSRRAPGSRRSLPPWNRTRQATSPARLLGHPAWAAVTVTATVSLLVRNVLKFAQSSPTRPRTRSRPRAVARPPGMRQLRPLCTRKPPQSRLGRKPIIKQAHLRPLKLVLVRRSEFLESGLDSLHTRVQTRAELERSLFLKTFPISGTPSVSFAGRQDA